MIKHTAVKLTHYMVKLMAK